MENDVSKFADLTSEPRAIRTDDPPETAVTYSARRFRFFSFFFFLHFEPFQGNVRSDGFRDARSRIPRSVRSPEALLSPSSSSDADAENRIKKREGRNDRERSGENGKKKKNHFYLVVLSRWHVDPLSAIPVYDIPACTHIYMYIYK